MKPNALVLSTDVPNMLQFAHSVAPADASNAAAFATPHGDTDAG